MGGAFPPLADGDNTIHFLPACLQAGLERLERLDQQPPTALLEAVRTVQEVSLLHRLMWRAAQLVPLRILFSIKHVPGRLETMQISIAQQHQQQHDGLRVHHAGLILAALRWLSSPPTLELRIERDAILGGPALAQARHISLILFPLWRLEVLDLSCGAGRDSASRGLASPSGDAGESVLIGGCYRRTDICLSVSLDPGHLLPSLLPCSGRCPCAPTPAHPAP